MATANELLAGVSTIDKTLVISNDLRTINIPSSVPNLGVEADDDVLRLNFKMPRYIGDTDLSVFNVRINYINAKGEDDVYTVKDVAVGAQYLTFSWLVGPTATKYKGDTKFNVCLKTLTSDGSIDREYNTTIATLPVLEGLETDERIVSMYPDLLEQWRQELFGIGDTEEASMKAVSAAEQEAIVNKGAEVLATIPVDYQTAVSMTDNADRTKADAIICSTQGEVITVADSSNDYLRGLKIFGKTTQVSTTGKQLIHITQATKTSNGITFTPNPDGSVYVKGTATANAYFIFDLNNPVPVIETELVASITGSDKVYMVVGYFTADGTIENSIASVDDKNTNTFVYPTAAVTTRTFLGVDSGKSVDATVYPLVRLASNSDDSYEPYSGGVASPSPDWPQELISIENPTVDVYGKNLLNAEMLIGGSFVKDGDGYRFTKLENTATSATCTLNLPAGDYVMSWGEIERTAESYRVYINYTDGTTQLTGLTNLGSNKLRFRNDVGINDIRLSLASNVTTDTYVKIAWLQIEAGVDATDYEPYVTKQSVSLNHALPGIPVTEGGNYTDENGQQWVCDEIDFERGVYIQRVRECELTGDDRWVVSGVQTGVKEGFTRYDGSVTTPGTARNESLWSHFMYKGTYVSDGYGAWVHTGNSSRVGVRVVTPHESVDALVEYLAAQYAAGTPVKFQYILDTPIETPLTAEKIQWFRFAHTNFPNTTVFNDAGSIMELKYNADTKTWLENLPKVVVGDSITLKDRSTSKSYTLYIQDGKLMMDGLEV